ncbi:MAG TPA: lysophospholipid acyltransferase family protein [Accumulibacter sp.]|uniref:1-acyl-sn-glycerol-3-phosphate acyltransferase n=2 Tax=Candidatus Accumulibacter TaxID=327159 RepID=A0A080M369_9PROT|nr:MULTISPECIES: lysophospholipid acyltransferase family protein [Candidatus Accumulibacter]KFB75526.1 MAG: 1-acylglycerol-3-phosphate O-acyltransferase [Candidatus Accumulibacter cognatus]MBL8399791.1 1-acyl-sn-glycerol-3-phosphate acyltransferase [Accumulibacter sp.]MBN8519156.1 1-acyl-sn-glycerol-3-phosphate acyltransferase [Accumulibacter sp.]MCC2867953.1 1-acyl-sn-glycerol-3-phosphate acyltransferase [Candidatus Accumulibacter phosphatis]MCM8578268.1 1-acyl-sn-glycerol-3-phosphate acyltra
MTDSRAGKPLWGAYECLAMALGLGTLALGCLIWLPFAMLLHPLLPRRIGQPLGRFVARIGFRGYLGVLSALCACRFDLDELDQLRDAGPLVLAANHPSLLDAVLVLARVPNTVCVMKADLMDNLLFGAAARLARFIRNDAPLAMTLDAGEELDRGARLLIFPEGTRTTAFPVDPCLATAGLIARRSQVPVQALLIEFSTPYLGKHWPLFRRPTLPLRCRIRLGRRFNPPQDVAAFAAELESHFRAELGPPWPSTVARPACSRARNAH